MAEGSPATAGGGAAPFGRFADQTPAPSEAKLARRAVKPSRDRVDADALGDELAAQPLGIVDQCALEGAVGARGKIDLETGDAGDDDDRGRFRFFEIRHRTGNRIDGVHHVGAERLLPGLGRIADRERADIADDAIDAAEFGGRALDPTFQRYRISDVDALAPGLDALRGEPLDDLGDLIAVSGADRDISALSREEFGDRKANALAAAGDQYALSLQSEIHSRLP